MVFTINIKTPLVLSLDERGTIQHDIKQS